MPKVRYFLRLVQRKPAARKSHEYVLLFSEKAIMLERKIQKDIHDYLKSETNKILVIDGARQIGIYYAMFLNSSGPECITI